MNSGLGKVLGLSVNQIIGSRNPDENWGNHNSAYIVTANPGRIGDYSLKDEAGYIGGRKVKIFCLSHCVHYECVIAATANTCMYQSCDDKTPKSLHIYHRAQTLSFHGLQVNIKVNEAYLDTVREAQSWAESQNMR